MVNRVNCQVSTTEEKAFNRGLYEGYKPYPTYTPSGVKWLGEIPAHWTLRRLKSFAVVQLSNVDKKSTEGQEAVRLCNYTDVYYNEHIGPDIEFMPATATEEQVRRFSLRARDVLITKDSEDWNDIAVPAVVIQDLPGVLCGYHLALIRPDSRCDGAFLSRALTAIGPRDQYQLSANGITRYGLTGDSIRASVLAFPPLAEQRAIAAFLDRETAKSDALVAQKERLIELLQEKRAALISRAVTRGLDPDAPMKDSGVEWLGEIPAHWEVKRLKSSVLSWQNGIWGAEPNGSNEIACVRVADFDRVKFRANIDTPTLRSVETDVLQTRKLSPGDLLLEVSGGGEKQPVGAVVLYDSKQSAVCSNFIAQLCPSEGFESLFLVYLHSALYSARVNVRSIKQSIGIQNLDKGSYLNEITGFPPLPEQRAIAAYLDRETAKIDALIAKIGEAIDRLKELPRRPHLGGGHGQDRRAGGGIMNVDVSERAFEDAIEAVLLRPEGVVAEEGRSYDDMPPGGYLERGSEDYDRELCLVPRDVLDFVLATQPREWKRLSEHHGTAVEERFLRRLASEIGRRGALDVLRTGVRDMGCKFDLAYFRPASGLNEETRRLHAANLFSVVRQLHYSERSSRSLDLALFLNGIPVFTAELKNPLTGQTVADAIRQYRTDRDPREPLLAPGRCLAHFAVDPDLIYVTTRLAGRETRFLPFNRGKFGGAGNRPVPPTRDGYPTSYLWEETWARDSVLDLVRQFVHEVQEEDDRGRRNGRRFLIFPRYQQLDCVRRLVADARREGTGQRYLVQHSAGSGKTFTIAWLAHRLSTLHDADDRRVFDSIVVITDRRVLDRQLQSAMRQFEQTLGVVENIDRTSRQLKDALEGGKTIIVTTLQKFPGDRRGDR